MNILITGASGFIGRHICHSLSLQHNVIAITHQHSIAENISDRVKMITMDLTDPNVLKSLANHNIDIIIALAQSHFYRQFPTSAEDIFAVNVNSLFHLLKWSELNNVKHFIYFSSANVYQQHTKPISETSAELTPTSFYATTKLMAEQLVKSFSEFVPSTILRLFTPYGLNQKDMLVPNLINAIYQQQEVTIYGTSGIKLSPIYISDICDAIKYLIDAEVDGCDIFNLAGSQEISFLEMVNIISYYLDKKAIIKQQPQCNEGGWVADISKIKSVFGYVPKIIFEDGIKQTINNFISQTELLQV